MRELALERAGGGGQEDWLWKTDLHRDKVAISGKPTCDSGVVLRVGTVGNSYGPDLVQGGQLEKATKNWRKQPNQNIWMAFGLSNLFKLHQICGSLLKCVFLKRYLIVGLSADFVHHS